MITIKEAREYNPHLNLQLFLPRANDIYAALYRTPVKQWLNFIKNSYLVPDSKSLIIFIPCECKKPYQPPRNELYTRILNLEKKISDKVLFVTLSDLLAILPREYWDFKWRNYNLIYDAPLFPWIEKYGYKWDENTAFKIWQKLNNVILSFYKRNKNRIEQIYVFHVIYKMVKCVLKDIPYD